MAKAWDGWEGGSPGSPLFVESVGLDSYSYGEVGLAPHQSGAREAFV